MSWARAQLDVPSQHHIAVQIEPDNVEHALADIDALHDHLAEIASPYGDGSASQQSVTAIESLFNL